MPSAPASSPFGFWAWGHFDWRHHAIRIDHDRFQQFHTGREPAGEIWQHDPTHRHGVPYRDPATAARFLGPSRRGGARLPRIAPAPAVVPPAKPEVPRSDTGRRDHPPSCGPSRAAASSSARLRILRPRCAGPRRSGARIFQPHRATAQASCPQPSFHAAPMPSFHAGAGGELSRWRRRAPVRYADEVRESDAETCGKQASDRAAAWRCGDRPHGDRRGPGNGGCHVAENLRYPRSGGRCTDRGEPWQSHRQTPRHPWARGREADPLRRSRRRSTRQDEIRCRL